MSKRIVIVSGGELDEALTCEILGEDENSFIIGVDKGVEFLYHHQIMPSYIVGDFDSASARSGTIIGKRRMYRFGNITR